MATRSKKKQEIPRQPGKEPLVPREWMDHIQDLLFSEDHDPEAIVRCLDQLDEAMRRRFEEEEQSQRYEEAIYREPSLTALAETLKNEHGQLLEEMGKLRQEFVASGGAPRNWQQFCDHFEEFCELYLEHETNEQTLTQDGIGGNDRVFRK